MAKKSVIRAAGVVLLRDAVSASGSEVLVVHRGLRQDWSLPKGKLEPGEPVIIAALRECDEESGYIPLLQSPLTRQEYEVAGEPKVVDYWRARIRSEEGFTPDDEVDEVRWIDVDDAAGLLTYESDLDLVREAMDLPDTSPLIILRHTRALKRSDYEGDVDAERPLTGRGRTEANDLIPMLDAYGPMEVHSSSARRCLDSVKKFARHQGSEIVLEDALTEEGHHAKPRSASRRAAEIAAMSHPVLICSHRPVLPTILLAVADELGIGARDGAVILDEKLSPGSFFVIHRRLTGKGNMRWVAIERHDVSSSAAH